MNTLYDVVRELIADLSKDEWEEIKKYIDENIDIIDEKHKLLEEAKEMARNLNREISWNSQNNGSIIKNRTRYR